MPHTPASVYPSILQTIGNTPVVQLHKTVPPDSARVFVKLEYFSPTGSYKDRMALAMLEAAEARGDLRPGITVVEYTGGSTGSSLAFVCAVKGYAFTAVSSVKNFGTVGILNPGPHGLSEILYAFTSGAANNGSAFGGLTVNTLWYDTAIGLTMLAGRFLMIIPMLAIAGNLAGKKYVPPSLGTFPVTTPLFTVLLIGVILIVGALTFFPVLSLGPILEHLLLAAGKTF